MISPVTDPHHQNRGPQGGRNKVSLFLLEDLESHYIKIVKCKQKESMLKAAEIM